MLNAFQHLPDSGGFRNEFGMTDQSIPCASFFSKQHLTNHEEGKNKLD